MSVEDFASALFGTSLIDCEYTLKGVDSLGKKLVNKTIKVELEKHPYEYTEAEAKKLLSTYLVDGWEAADDGYYDFRNHHNHGKQSVSINVHRYVAA